MIRTFRTLLFIAIVVMGLLALGLNLADPGPPQAVQADGASRINCHNASPIVIYCSRLGVEVYSPTGQLLLFVSSDEIEAAGTPATNTLVGGVEGQLAMYVLSTGEYQINYWGASELYTAIWTGCYYGSADIKVYDRATGALLSDDDGCEILTCGPEPAVEEDWDGPPPAYWLDWAECYCGPDPGPDSGDTEWLECMCNTTFVQLYDAPFCGRDGPPLPN
ncbi:MAG: hypothetical protein Kow0077_15570 [Anaerolineae bacterium]